MAERVSRSGADKRRAALRRAEPGRTKSWCRGYLSKAPWCVRGLKADATLARREANMPCWTAPLLLAAALAVAGAAVAPKANDDVCHGQKQSCLDSRTLVICADLGAGLIPLNNLPCPAAYPFCKDGVCGLEPSTTTTTTTTITPPPDPCAGGERSCPDEHTLRVCVDLGAGLIFNSDTPCSPQAPFCVQGACVAAPTTTRLPPTNRPQPTTTPRPTPGPTTLPPASCGGQTVSCLDDATVLECADLGFGLVPVKEVRCGGSTPVCRAGTCGALPPTTPTAGTTTTARPAPPADICGGKLSVCGDCYTRTTCARIGREIVPVSNTTCPADQPYCVAGACEADLPADSSCPALPAPFSSFKCFADGYFPDPSDCRRFHLCVGDKAYDYDCTQAAAGLIYDQARALCVPLGQAQCFAFDCRGRASAYLTYRPDPTIYALCVTEDAADALLARCPAGRSLAVDPQNGLSVSCQPFCARAGRTADPDDASSFYECFATSAKSSARLVGPLKGSCPQGSEFDAASERCRSVAPAKPDSTTVITAATTIAPSAKKPWWW